MPFSASEGDDGLVVVPLYAESDTLTCTDPDEHNNLGGPVGNFIIDYTAQTKLVMMTFSVNDNYFITDTHLYVGGTPLYDVGNGPIFDLSDFMYTNEGITSRPVNDTHYTRGCLPENYIIGHVHVCGPGPVTQFPTVATAAPTDVDFELVELTMEYMVPQEETRSPTQEEIELLICETDNYLTAIFDTYLDSTIDIIAEDLHWTYSEGEEYQVAVDFDIVAYFADNRTKVPRPIVEKILVETFDTDDYVRNFVWESSTPSGYFYNVNSVASRLAFVNRKPFPGFTSSHCGNLVVTMPTVSPSSPPSSTPSTGVEPSNPPSVKKTYMILQSEFQLSYFDGFTPRELTSAEFDILMDTLRRFYTDVLGSTYPNRFQSFDLEINLHTFDISSYYEEYIDFNAMLQTKPGMDLTNVEMFTAMQDANYENLITQYFWSLGRDSIFYEVNEVAFNAICGGDGGCDRRLMKRIRYNAKRRRESN